MTGVGLIRETKKRQKAGTKVYQPRDEGRRQKTGIRPAEPALAGTEVNTGSPNPNAFHQEVLTIPESRVRIPEKPWVVSSEIDIHPIPSETAA